MMTVTFSSEAEQGIEKRARERGVAPDEYVRELVNRDIAPPVGPLHMTVEEFLSELQEIGRDLPVLPERAYSRENMYEGRS